MCSTSNRELAQHADDPRDEVEYLCIAADLLQQMFWDLRTLATNNIELARAISSRGSDAEDRLWTLQHVLDLLVGADSHSGAVLLKRQASALISWLSDEIDELSLYASNDEPQTALFRIVLH
jgi:hypothetical protein